MASSSSIDVFNQYISANKCVAVKQELKILESVKPFFQLWKQTSLQNRSLKKEVARLHFELANSQRECSLKETEVFTMKQELSKLRRMFSQTTGFEIGKQEKPFFNKNRRKRSAGLENIDEERGRQIGGDSCYTPLRPAKRRSYSINDANEPPTPTVGLAPLATLNELEEKSQKQRGIKFIQSDCTNDPPLRETPKCHFRRRSLSLPSKKTPHSSSSRESTPEAEGTLSRAMSARLRSNSPTTSSEVLAAHNFYPRRCFLKNITCYVCTEKVSFGVEMQACKRCKAYIHKLCMKKLPASFVCVPWKETPKTATSGRRRLADYCSETKPRLPHLIVHCVQRLNSCLSHIDLYSVMFPSAEAEVLYRKFIYDRHIPNCSDIHYATVSQCLLKFMYSLREPLILQGSFHEFTTAVQENNDANFQSAVEDLPTVHRNTLAYLVVHWKKYLDASGVSQETLARVILPVIMRGIRVENIDSYLPIFYKMLEMPDGYWNDLIDKADENTFYRSGSKHGGSLTRATTTAQLQFKSSYKNFNFDN